MQYCIIQTDFIKRRYGQIKTVQEWIPYDYILDNGIVKLKNNSFIKIIEVIPINYNLKSELEKESILNSYKILLKTCQFNIQILVQSRNENLSSQIQTLKEYQKSEDSNIVKISNQYINSISRLNENSSLSSKSFFIVLKNSNTSENQSDQSIIDSLNENYIKIKECLSRCGNYCYDIDNKQSAIEVIKSFLKIDKLFTKKGEYEYEI